MKRTGAGRHCVMHMTAQGHWLALLAGRLVYCNGCGDFIGAVSKRCRDDCLPGTPFINERSPTIVASRDQQGALSPIPESLKGIYNLGNTCFMSCVLQALAHSSARVTKASPRKMCDICLGCELEDFFVALFEYDEDATLSVNALVPQRVLYATWKFADQFAGYKQHDAHEYLIYILGSLVLHRETAVHKNFLGLFCSDIAPSESHVS